MLISFVIVWNVIVSYISINTVGVESWLRIMVLLTELFAFGVPLEVLLLFYMGRFRALFSNMCRWLSSLLSKWLHRP